MNLHISPLISLEGASVGYHGRPVLTDVTLRLYRGRLTVLSGPNGSGKSTILKTVVGILPPIKGEVRHDGRDLRRPRWGYVPQRETLEAAYPLSVLDVVLMGTLTDRPSWTRAKKAHHDIAMACLDQVGSKEHSHHPFGSLSGGHKQRVLIARALATQPDCLVMDEPTSGVDRESVQAIFALLEHLKQKNNLSILIVSHEAEKLTGMADVIIRIEQGRLVTESIEEH